MRGAWIEMCYERGIITPEITSLPVRGAWIEMLHEHGGAIRRESRSPCGERGLKSLCQVEVLCTPPSLPVRGAWIEIFRGGACASPSVVSLPVRGAWIEIVSGRPRRRACGSLPVRGAWIEMIFARSQRACASAVAPRAGSVD